MNGSRGNGIGVIRPGTAGFAKDSPTPQRFLFAHTLIEALRKLGFVSSSSRKLAPALLASVPM
jgi:hypothetical protein